MINKLVYEKNKQTLTFCVEKMEEINRLLGKCPFKQLLKLSSQFEYYAVIFNRISNEIGEDLKCDLEEKITTLKEKENGK